LSMVITSAFGAMRFDLVNEGLVTNVGIETFELNNKC
jgi:hypothetical protein